MTDHTKALADFHAFFRDRCEALFATFGPEAVALYNAAGAPSLTVGDQERFEAFAKDQGFPLRRTVHGDEYFDYRTVSAWEGFQEGAKHARTAQPAAQAEPVELPHPGSPEASAMIDSVLAEYQWPTNAKNAARAGYVAAKRMLRAKPSNPPAQQKEQQP